MKFLVDENIPQAKEAFGSLGDITFTAGRSINNDMIKDVDVLLLRAVTKVNEDLIKNSNIKFVGTATAGTDHIDKIYLAENEIKFEDAAGCNSYSVAEYVVTALAKFFIEKNESFKNKKIGVVGCGNVGSKVVRFAEALGFTVLKNDPPLQRRTNDPSFTSLEEIFKCDVITLHVPLNLSGIDKTYKMISESELVKFKRDIFFINTSRGEIVDTPALKSFISKSNSISVIDVWENEPNIDVELMKLVNIGTPHIAGYSLEGKLNGTKFLYDKLCTYLNNEKIWRPKYPAIDHRNIKVEEEVSIEKLIEQITNVVYPIQADYELLLDALNYDEDSRKKHFDGMRKNYRVRREFNNYQIQLGEKNKGYRKVLESLRFTVI